MMNRFYQSGRSVFGFGVNQLLSKSSLVVFLTMFFSLSVFAQDLTVTGKVTDKGGDGLPGVTVQVKGTTKGAQTDLDGRFSISGVPSNGTLTFSFVGMTSQEVAVGGRSSVNVTLSDDAAMLEEVVVIGYGTVKKKDATGAVNAIGTKDFNKGIITNTQQLMQGRVAGVAVTQIMESQAAVSTFVLEVLLRYVGVMVRYLLSMECH